MSDSFDALLGVMARLRGEGGCPWDREQTSESLKPYLIEEAYEVYEAIESGRAEPLCEELGDLLFQVLFHAEIAKERDLFDIEKVLKTVTEKMIRRHPHVFTPEGEDAPAMDSKAVLGKWEEIKKKEDRHRNRKSILDGVPKQLPALLRAHQLQARAARVGFDWKTEEPVLAKVEEELQELCEAVTRKNTTEIENELGDLLFSIVNVARFLNVNPEDALRGTNQRFTRRFHKMESATAKNNSGLKSLSLEEMDRLWEEAKAEERASLPLD